MLDTVDISGEDVCCSVVFGTLVCVSVFSVIWSEFCSAWMCCLDEVYMFAIVMCLVLLICTLTI